MRSFLVGGILCISFEVDGTVELIFSFLAEGVAHECEFWEAGARKVDEYLADYLDGELDEGFDRIECRGRV